MELEVPTIGPHGLTFLATSWLEWLFRYLWHIKNNSWLKMNHLVHIDWYMFLEHAQIMDSLQYLVDEFHVDGFCFVNAACLVTGPHGQELSRPVLVEAITFDPVLASTKLIADSCSPFNGIWKVTKINLSWRMNFTPQYIFLKSSRCSKYATSEA